MSAIIGIYKITSPSGKIYIGRSLNCNQRKNIYKNLLCDRQPKLYNSLLKYGWINHKFEIIHQCDESQLNDLEIYYITLYNTFDTNVGLNLQSGGGVRRQSEETKDKIGKAHRGKILSEVTRNKISKSMIGHKRWLGKKHTDETKAKMKAYYQRDDIKKIKSDRVSGINNPMYNRNVSEETRDRIRKAVTGKNVGLKSPFAKPVIQKDFNGNIIALHESISLAKKNTGVDTKSISFVCNGKYSQAGGFLWEYKVAS